MKKIAIFGAGGFGREVKWLIDEVNAVSPGWTFIGYFDDDFSKMKSVGSEFFLGGTDALNAWTEELALVFAVGDPLIKRKIFQNVSNQFIYYPRLIHPAVYRSNEHVEIGEGTIICAGNILTVNINIGRHVILNLSCTVGHDTSVGDFCSFMPAVNISGEVNIGEAVYIGSGAKLINQISIGEETIIGAGAVVTKSLPSRCTAVGVPAIPIKLHSNH